MPLVYDILNCGPRNRFAANGKLVHNCNPQNFSKKDGIRDAITIPDGFKLVVADLSQIEARLVAYVAGQMDLVEAFRDGRDPYCEFGNRSRAFDVEVTKKTFAERFLSKQVMLGGGFGAGPGAMERQARNVAFNLGLKIDLDVDWQVLNDAYREQNPMIKGLWKATDTALRNLIKGRASTFGTDGLMRYEITNMGPAFVMPNGQKIFYHGLRLERDEETGDEEMRFDYVKFRSTVPRKVYGAKAVENAIQALAGLIIREMWSTIVKRARKDMGIKYGSIVLQCHDELVAMVRDEHVSAYRVLMTQVMSVPPVWAPGLPVACETGVGQTYGEAK